jgi:hypothetical protein
MEYEYNTICSDLRRIFLRKAADAPTSSAVVTWRMPMHRHRACHLPDESLLETRR